MTLSKDDLGSHRSQRFNEELEALHRNVMVMGALVSSQLRDAVRALGSNDQELAVAVIARDPQINNMELKLDEECNLVLVRRQPAASDLRLVFAVLKTVTDLERMGDLAKRVARAVIESTGVAQERFGSPISHLGGAALELVDKSLDAFDRLDVATAREIRQDDREIDEECKAITRQLLTYMMEDPRTIGSALHLVWATRAMERIGDHAKNIAEYVVYAVHGKDMRHTGR